MSDAQPARGTEDSATPAPPPPNGPDSAPSDVLGDPPAPIHIDLEDEALHPPGAAPAPAGREDDAEPPAVDLRMLAPQQQRTFLQVHPERIAFVSHVVAPPYAGDPPLLVVKDGPTKVEVTNLPAL